MTKKPQAREPIGKQLRFEVFKRDSFTCQYCGAKAPETILHCDHINPVADGGKNDIMNLITACEGCNLGKGARRLDDSSVVEKQRAQMQELQERREQLEMMLKWRDALQTQKTDVVDEICERIEQVGFYGPNESGRVDIAKWVKRFGAKNVLEAADLAMDSYLEWHGERPTDRSWRMAFSKMGAIAYLKSQAELKPYMPKLAYVQGILRRRFNDKFGNYIKALEELHLDDGASLEMLEHIAKISPDWDGFCTSIILSLGGDNGQN